MTTLNEVPVLIEGSDNLLCALAYVAMRARAARNVRLVREMIKERQTSLSDAALAQTHRKLARLKLSAEMLGDSRHSAGIPPPPLETQ
jgi:hypothetical protein